MVKNQGTNQREQRTLGDVGNEKLTGSVLKETIAVSVMMSISVQKIDTAEFFSEFFHAAE